MHVMIRKFVTTEKRAGFAGQTLPVSDECMEAMIRDQALANAEEVPFHKLTMKQALMQIQRLDDDEADEWIASAREDVADGMNPEEVLYCMGLGPDYVCALYGYTFNPYIHVRG